MLVFFHFWFKGCMLKAQPRPNFQEQRNQLFPTVVISEIEILIGSPLEISKKGVKYRPETVTGRFIDLNGQYICSILSRH